MKLIITAAVLSAFAMPLMAETVSGPDGKLSVEVGICDGKPCYSVVYDGIVMLKKSSLGFTSNIGDYTGAASMTASPVTTVEESYDLPTIKKSHVDYKANELVCTYTTPQKQKFDVIFRVSDNDVAFRYHIPKETETGSIYISSEATGFNLPQGTTTFLTPQCTPMIGWKRTKPSYEEQYKADAPMTDVSQYGLGYTFPALFRNGDKGWVLVSETGVDSRYTASHLSDFNGSGYTIAFPSEAENNGNGLTGAAMALPAYTPWRTITTGTTLSPIVETTVPWDVVKPLYPASEDYKYGKGTWSWIVWQDGSINKDDQVKFIDLAGELGYDYVLTDNWWDTQIGREGMRELADYARTKGVKPIIWYSSSGYWNDIEQSPINRMDRALVRKPEMKWLRDIGAAGIKVDFFGGDKQETMRLYEDIISDADDHGLMVIFHGCTLPRGWERMYPNYIGSEAVLASENVYFEERYAKMAPFNASLHPFIRNAVGCMEYGGTFLNRRLSRDNKSRHPRHTTDAFELATAVLFQNPVQNFAVTPNNLTDAPALCIDFVKRVPSLWDEVKYIDGYPGRYAVIARRHGDKWYIAGVNGTGEPLKLSLDLPMIAPGEKYSIIRDRRDGEPEQLTLKARKSINVEMMPAGGFVIETLQNRPAEFQKALK